MKGNTKIYLCFILFICVNCLLAPVAAFGQEGMTSREYIKWFYKEYFTDQVNAYGQMNTYTPEELLPILQLEEKGDQKGALRAYDELINRDVKSFPSLPYSNWVKSLAYINSSKIKAKLQQSWVDDMANAADLGNVQAASLLSQSMLKSITEKAKNNPQYKNVKVYPDELETYLRVGAELGSSVSADLLGSNTWPNRLSEREKIYWKLIGISFAQIENKAVAMESMIQEFGNQKVNQAVKEFSLTEGLISADASGLPGRGTVATIYTDSNLRRTYGESYGRRQVSTRSANTPSTLDEFRLLSAIGDETGLYKAYMMVPGGRKFTDPAIISLKNDEIVKKLSSGDTVIVRCGPMAHLAVAYKIDERIDRIYFADGLFQYWQPTHNSCIKDFMLTPHKYGGFLAGISLKEITPMIQAVITFRDRAPLKQ